jgi:hypothetical protein
MYINRESSSYPQLKKLEKYLKGHSGFIAGGCFRNIFNNEPIKDVDIFFEREGQFDSAKEFFKNSSAYKLAYETANTIAFEDIETRLIIELVKKRFGKPEDILKSFDFTICQFALHYDEFDLDFLDNPAPRVIFHRYYFEHLHLKKLEMECIPQNPVSTFDRLFRYTKYGYKVSRELKSQIICEIRNTSDFDGLTESWY